MTRISLRDGSWFDKDNAKKFEALTKHDSPNTFHWNCVTETFEQYNGVDLYRTKNGKWVSLSWSIYEGGIDTYAMQDEEFAKKFLSQNELLDDLEEFFPGSVAALEI